MDESTTARDWHFKRLRGMKQLMMHFSCDRCKKLIEEHDVRYVVRVESRAAIEDETPDDIETEQRQTELAELLDRLDDGQRELVEAQLHQVRQYDLCVDCHEQLMDNPFGGESLPVAIGFSSN